MTALNHVEPTQSLSRQPQGHPEGLTPATFLLGSVQHGLAPEDL